MLTEEEKRNVVKAVFLLKNRDGAARGMEVELVRYLGRMAKRSGEEVLEYYARFVKEDDGGEERRHLWETFGHNVLMRLEEEGWV